MQHAATEHLALTVLTINEVALNPYTGQPSVIPEDEVMLDKARQAAEDTVAKAGREMSSVPAVTVNAVTGLAGEELILASQHADMLVIGSRGQRGFPALR
jgi:nucleotide-binding universal stress UspA family protein